MMKISVFYKKALSVLITVCIFCGVSLIAFAEDINDVTVPAERQRVVGEALRYTSADGESAEVFTRDASEAPKYEGEEPEDSCGSSETQRAEMQETAEDPETDAQEELHEPYEYEQTDGRETSPSDVLAEAPDPSWLIYIPDNPPVAYGSKVVNISAATAVDIEDLGDNVIYMTITSNCVFGGKADEMPVRLCVDGIPVTPGDIVVYGMVTSQGAEYAPVTLLFSENGWDAITSGSYSLTISYDSYLG